MRLPNYGLRYHAKARSKMRSLLCLNGPHRYQTSVHEVMKVTQQRLSFRFVRVILVYAMPMSRLHIFSQFSVWAWFCKFTHWILIVVAGWCGKIGCRNCIASSKAFSITNQFYFQAFTRQVGVLVNPIQRAINICTSSRPCQREPGALTGLESTAVQVRIRVIQRKLEVCLLAWAFKVSNGRVWNHMERWNNDKKQIKNCVSWTRCKKKETVGARLFTVFTASCWC